jgi:ribosome-binding factor A
VGHALSQGRVRLSNMLCFGLLGGAPTLRVVHGRLCPRHAPVLEGQRPASSCPGNTCCPIMMGRRGGNSGGAGAGGAGGRGRPRRGDGRRPNRVAEVIRREIAAIVDDAFAQMPGFGGDAPVLVSVVDVRCSDDLRNARVGVSVLGSDDQKKLALAWLRDNRKLLRFELAACISSMKYVPDLVFAESEVAQAVRAVSIIDMLARERELKRERRSNSSSSEAADTGNEATMSGPRPFGSGLGSPVTVQGSVGSGDDDLDLDARAENPFADDIDDVDDDDNSDNRRGIAAVRDEGSNPASQGMHNDEGIVDELDDDNIIDIDDDDDDDEGDEYENMTDATLLSSLYKTLPDVTDLPGQWKIPRNPRS